jgi:hypothetical protein
MAVVVYGQPLWIATRTIAGFIIAATPEASIQQIVTEIVKATVKASVE